MLLEAHPGVTALRQYRELVCPAGKHFISQFQLILSDCAMAFYLLCPSVPIYRSTPAPELGGSDVQPTWWVREALVPSAPLPVTHARAKQHFGTNSILWDPGSKQFPESVTGTCGLTQLLQAEEVQVIFRLLLQDWRSMAAVTLWAPSSPTERVAVCGDALAVPAGSRHHPTPSLSSQLHSFSAYRKGSLELPLLCLWMCLCLEATQKHSRSRAQLRRD